MHVSWTGRLPHRRIHYEALLTQPQIRYLFMCSCYCYMYIVLTTMLYINICCQFFYDY